MPATPKRRPSRPLRIVAGLTILTLAAIAVVAVQQGWFHRGFSATQVARLKADWAHLRGLAAEVPAPLAGEAIGSGADSPGATPASDSAHESALESDAGAEALVTLLLDWSVEPDEARTSDLERARDLLSILHAHPTAAPVLPDGTPLETHALTPLADAYAAALADPTLTLDDLTHLAALARRVQARGPLLPFVLGQHLLEQVLDHVESDPARRTARAAALAPVPAPEPDELFLALCREVAHADAAAHHAVHGPSGPGASPTGPPSPAEARALEFTELAHRRALVDQLLPLIPLRDDPARWASITLPEPPSGLSAYWAMVTQDPEGMAQMLAPMSALRTQELGPRWAEMVERWEQVVGR